MPMKDSRLIRVPEALYVLLVKASKRERKAIWKVIFDLLDKRG